MPKTSRNIVELRVADLCGSALTVRVISTRQNTSARSRKEGSPWYSPSEKPLSTRQLRRYLRCADNQLVATLEKDRGRQLAIILAQHNSLYTRSERGRNWSRSVRLKAQV